MTSETNNNADAGGTYLGETFNRVCPAGGGHVLPIKVAHCVIHGNLINPHLKQSPGQASGAALAQ